MDVNDVFELQDENLFAKYEWLELIPTPVFLCDQSMTIVKSNSHASSFFDLNQAEPNTVQVSDLIAAESHYDYFEYWNLKSLKSGTSTRQRIEIKLNHGHNISGQVQLQIDEINSYGTSLFLLIFTRISEFELANPSLMKNEVQIAEYLDRFRHELKSPLAGIRVFTDVLLRNETGNLSEKQVDQLGAIIQALGRVADLVDTLAAQKIPAGVAPASKRVSAQTAAS